MLKKVTIIIGILLLIAGFNSKAQESMKFESEAKSLSSSGRC